MHPSNSQLRINIRGLALIRKFEGFQPRPYTCPGGDCTVGYGHVVHKRPCDGRPSEQKYRSGLSEDDALALLANDVRGAEDCVRRRVRVPLSEDQFSALTSFVFNLGCGAFQASTLLARLNAARYSEVPEQLGRWCKSGGKVLQGLVKRRAAEVALWKGTLRA
jgi:GH24 family phage-related lysozyme (muramidase)